MADDNKYVENLLRAEEQANEIIRKAQKEREKKLKEARVAAEKDINQFRQEKQEQFDILIKKEFGSTQEELELERKTQNDIQRINQDFERNKATVLNMLIERIINVDLEIPKVYQKTQNL